MADYTGQSVDGRIVPVKLRDSPSRDSARNVVTENTIDSHTPISPSMIREEGAGLVRDALDVVFQVAIAAIADGKILGMISEEGRPGLVVQLIILCLFFAFWSADLLMEPEVVSRESKACRYAHLVACVAAPVAFIISIISAALVAIAVPGSWLTPFRDVVVLLILLLSLTKIVNGASRCATLYNWRCRQLDEMQERFSSTNY